MVQLFVLGLGPALKNKCKNSHLLQNKVILPILLEFILRGQGPKYLGPWLRHKLENGERGKGIVKIHKKDLLFCQKDGHGQPGSPSSEPLIIFALLKLSIYRFPVILCSNNQNKLANPAKSLESQPFFLYPSLVQPTFQLTTALNQIITCFPSK